MTKLMLSIVGGIGTCCTAIGVCCAAGVCCF